MKQTLRMRSVTSRTRCSRQATNTSTSGLFASSRVLVSAPRDTARNRTKGRHASACRPFDIEKRRCVSAGSHARLIDELLGCVIDLAAFAANRAVYVERLRAD